MRPRNESGAPRVQVRAAAAAAAMAVLLAAAAVGTRGDGTGATAPPGTAAAATAGHHGLVIAIAVLAPILTLLGGALFVYAQIFRRRERDPEVLKRIKRARRRTAIALAILLAVVAYSVRSGHRPFAFLHLRNPFSTGSVTTAPTARPHRPVGAHPAVSNADWTVVVLIWILLVAAATILVVRSRTSRGPLAAAAAPAAEDETGEPEVARLRRERNPRRAVIAAYSAMERLMARDGLPRGAHEAPMEYLGRVTLEGHGGVAAVHRLTALFQRARFSLRPVDEEMRGRAIAAVAELEGERGSGT